MTAEFDSRGAPVASGSPSITFPQLETGKIYRYESGTNGFNTNTYFYENGGEVVAFDAQFTPELAHEALAFLRTKTESPVRYLVVTHPNPDKFNGMSVFQEAGAQVVMSRATAEAMPNVHAYKKYFFVNMACMFTDETYPVPTQPDIVFDKEFELKVGRDFVDLAEIERPGVSSNQTVAWIQSMASLVVGDLAHPGGHLWLEGGILDGQPNPTLSDWILMLKDLKSAYGEYNKAVLLGGRGHMELLVRAIDEAILYLKKAEAIVSAYIQTLDDAHAALQGERALGHYARLQQEFERAFPTYRHSYLIKYGVYGLVNSKL